MDHIDGSVQDCSISIANALEILQSCTEPSIFSCRSSSPTWDTDHFGAWQATALISDDWWPRSVMPYGITRARFLSLAQSKLRLCSANHRPGYWSNLPCDWLSTAWAYWILRARDRKQALAIMSEPQVKYMSSISWFILLYLISWELTHCGLVTRYGGIDLD